MCSISINEIVAEQLELLQRSDDRDMIERRLFQFASEATINHPGALDLPKTHMKNMPTELQHLRKIRIGRHRIYYKGHHTDCAYETLHIKIFKKTGVNEEYDRRFQSILMSRLAQPQVTKIEPTS